MYYHSFTILPFHLLKHLGQPHRHLSITLPFKPSLLYDAYECWSDIFKRTAISHNIPNQRPTHNLFLLVITYQ